MEFTLPKLPYAPDALEPVISTRTVEYHWGKHERGYIDTLNKMIAGTDYENMDLEDIILNSEGKLFNNAAQAWNHIFYFLQFSPKGQKGPGGSLAARIDKDFGSLEAFQKDFEEAGATLFGSGWVWLACDTTGKLFLLRKENAGTPLTDGLTPLMVFDVWEHAYYLDYQNLRAKYLHNLWDILDWNVIDGRYPF